ncbi:MAG: hypothetical protein WDZ27_04740 [Waddliaceae bacterium]
MKFAIAPEHRRYFEQHGAIELEGLLAPEKLEALRVETAAIDPVNGRDLWRKNQKIRSIVTSRAFGEIIWQFCDFRPVLLGFDQLFGSSTNSEYQAFIQNPHSLDDFCHFQGVKASLILCLRGENSLDATFDGLPSNPGAGVVYHSEYPIPFHLMKEGRYLMIVYTHDKTVVKRNSEDFLSTASFSDVGYNNGDRMNHKINPILVK